MKNTLLSLACLLSANTFVQADLNYLSQLVQEDAAQEISTVALVEWHKIIHETLLFKKMLQECQKMEAPFDKISAYYDREEQALHTDRSNGIITNDEHSHLWNQLIDSRIAALQEANWPTYSNKIRDTFNFIDKKTKSKIKEIVEKIGVTQVLVIEEETSKLPQIIDFSKTSPRYTIGKHGFHTCLPYVYITNEVITALNNEFSTII
jgi:hypothetical protein